MGKRIKRNVIVLEGRGAWNLAKYKDKVYVDSPVLNIVHATLIAKKLLEKGEQVVMLPVIDKLVSTAEYNFPSTFYVDYLKEKGKENLSDEEKRELFNLWREVKGIEVIPHPKAKEVIEESNAKDKELFKVLLSHQMQKFARFKDRQRSLAEKDYRDMIEKMEKLAPTMMSTFDIETTKYLINLILGDVDKSNFHLNFLVSPSPFISSKTNIMHSLDRLFRYYNFLEGVKKLNKLFGELGEGIPKNSLPVFFDINGYFNSPMWFSVENKGNTISINLRSRVLGKIGEKYKISPESFLEELQGKSLVSFKYPLVLIDYLHDILKSLTVKNSVKSSLEGISEVIERAIGEEGFRLEKYIEEKVKESNREGEVDRFYFVEGDLGRVNPGTGGLVDTLFSKLSEKIGADYIRVISLEREVLEDKLKVISYREILNEINKLENKGGSLYLSGEGEKLRRIEDIV